MGAQAHRTPRLLSALQEIVIRGRRAGGPQSGSPGTEMVRYIIRRLLWTVVTLIIVSFVTFLMFYVLPPGDPAVLRAGHFPNPLILAHIRHVLGVDRPFWTQYWIYVRGIVVHFNFGYSYQYSQPVTHLILPRLPATISLTVGAVAVWLLIGLPVGAISAVHKRSLIDRTSMIGALVALSVPAYLMGFMALLLLSRDIGDVHIFDGAGTYAGLTANPGRWFGSLILPWFTLAAGFAAFYARLLRSSLVETMSEDYVRTARAMGLPERRVIVHHAIRSAITPIVTVLGMDIGMLLGGVVITETVFAIPGVGYLAWQGIQNADLPIIQGTVQLGAFFIVIANLIVDIAYAFLDPRVRFS